MPDKNLFTAIKRSTCNTGGSSYMPAVHADATMGSSGSVNIDGIMAASNAVKMSPEAPKFIIDDLPEWVTLGTELMKEQKFMENKTKENENNEGTQLNSKPYSGYKKGTILNTSLGNVKVQNDSEAICCQESKATDTIPPLKKRKD